MMDSKNAHQAAFKEGGFTLVELVVAIGILTLSFTGILSLMNHSLGLSRTVRDNYTATYLATEGIEVAKNILDANYVQRIAWNDGFLDGNYTVSYASQALTSSAAPACDHTFNPPLRFDDVARRYSYTSGSNTNFRRLIKVALRGSNEVRVNSIVCWRSRRAVFEVNLEDHFLNWRFY